LLLGFYFLPTYSHHQMAHPELHKDEVLIKYKTIISILEVDDQNNPQTTCLENETFDDISGQSDKGSMRT
jgi:hypothetical protein